MAIDVICFPKQNISAKRFFDAIDEKYGLALLAPPKRWAQIHFYDPDGEISGAITLQYFTKQVDVVPERKIPVMNELLGEGWEAVGIGNEGASDEVLRMFEEIPLWLKATFGGIDPEEIPTPPRPPLDPDPVRAAVLEAIEDVESRIFSAEQSVRGLTRMLSEAIAEGDKEEAKFYAEGKERRERELEEAQLKLASLLKVLEKKAKLAVEVSPEPDAS